MPLAKYGQDFIAAKMFQRGKNFAVAAVLLDKNEGSKEVVFHLLAQGLEILLKSLIIAKDFRGNISRLRSIGHDLERGNREFRKLYNLNPEREAFQAQLQVLNVYFKRHHFRYAGLDDLLGGFDHIETDLIIRRILASMEFGTKVFEPFHQKYLESNSKKAVGVNSEPLRSSESTT